MKPTQHLSIEEFMNLMPIAAAYITSGQIYLNRKAEELTGYLNSDFESLDDYFRKVYKSNYDPVMEIYLNAKKRNFEGVDRVVFPTKNGEEKVIDFQTNFYGNHEVWIFNDVTDKILAEERFTVLFNHSTDAHLLFDETGIIDCNQAAVKLMNAKSKDVLLKLHPAFFSPEYQPCGMKSLEKNKIMDALAHENGFHRFEWIHKKMNGEEFPVEVTLNPVEVANKRLLLVVWHDLTDQKRTQKALEEEHLRNFHASKMATLGEMASGIAHEINNPLTVILNRAQQIKKQLSPLGPDFELTASAADKIYKTADRIAKIVRGLRHFAREGSPENKSEVPLNLILEEALDFCRARFESSEIQLSLEYINISDAENEKLICNQIQIEQVLLNLLNNAFDAVSQSKGAWVKVIAERNQENVSISVVDSGKGIPENIRAKIMLPFFTTKDVGQGTGIGLSISSGIMKSHGGELVLDSESAFTKFVLKFPKAA